MTSHPDTPSWAESDEIPDAKKYLPSECFVAGAISTMAPFREYHPAWCLPFARQAIKALGEWKPDDYQTLEEPDATQPG